MTLDPMTRHVNDVDVQRDSVHHTLGLSPNQASPGDHRHDDFYSFKDHNHDGSYSSKWSTGDVKTSFAPADNVEWFELNGQASPTPELTALFGANLPDLRDRFIIGASGTKNPGDTGGSATKTISTANMPSHTHGPGNLGTDNPGDHTHGIKTRDATGASNVNAQGGGVLVPDSNTNAAGGHTHLVTTGNTGPTGSGTAMDIMPPWVAMRVLVHA